MTIRPQHRPFRALALEPRILLDAAMVETAKEVTEQSSETGDSGWIDRPTLTATPVDMNLTVKDSNDEFPAIDLFDDVTVAANSIFGEDETYDDATGETAGRPLRDLTITVSATGASHALVVDGTTIPLQSTDLAGQTANNAYTYTISVSGDTTTITIAINSSNIPTARTAVGAAALIDSIAYQAQSRDVTTGDLSVSLKLNESNTDGSAGNSTLGRITSTVHITRDSDIPVAPGISTGPTLEVGESFDSDKGLPGADQVTYSSNGKYAYTAGAGTFATFSVDASGRLTLVDSITVANLGAVESLVASSDGKSVYSMSTNGQLVEMSINANGTLSHVGTHAISDSSSGSLAISSDGSQVYADGGDGQRGIKVYSRDTSTGRLLVSQQIPSLTMSGTAYDALNNGTGNYNGASISITRSNGANAKDGYDFSTLYFYDEDDGSGGTLSYRDGQIFFDDYSSEITIASFVNTNGTLTVTFTEAVSTKMVNRVLNQISFQTSTSENIGITLKVDTHTQNVSLESHDFALSPVQQLDNAIRQATVVQAGNYLYVVNNSGNPIFGDARTLEVYQRNSDGTWSVLDNFTKLGANSDWGSTTDPIVISPDGLYVYVSAHDSGTLDVYQLNTTSGFLSQVNSIALPGNAENAETISLSADGKTLYIVTDNGSASIYGVSGSRLTLQGSVSGITNGDSALSNDGLSLIIANGQGITRYSLARTLNLGESIAFADGLKLSDNNSDKLAGGAGDYKDASITITPSILNGSFGFAENNGLRLAEGKILHNGTAIANFTTGADGSLTITFTANSSTAVANQVLQQITYGISDASTAGLLVDLRIQANDGELTSTAQSITLRVNALPTLDTGVADGYVLRGATSETAYSFTLFPGLFGDADGDVLTWSVSGLPAGLVFDAKTLSISGIPQVAGTFTITVTVADASGKSASLDLALEVEQIANRAPQVNADANLTIGNITENTNGSLTLDRNIFTDADTRYGDGLIWSVSGLPQGFNFNPETLTISGTSGTTGNYSFTATVTDNAGQTASTELTLRIITEAEANNTAPSITAPPSALTYNVDGNLGGGSYYVQDMQLSANDNILVVVANTSAAHALTATGAASIYVYSRDTATGALTQLQRFVQGTADDGNQANGTEVDGMANATSVVYSADGKYLYIAGKNASGEVVITAFNVNSDGTLSATGLSEVVGTSQITSLTVSDDGSMLYAVSVNSVHALSVSNEGGLTLVGSYAAGSSAYDVALDANGHVYVLSGTSLIVYSANSDGSLTQLVSQGGIGLNGLNRGFAVRDDGYVFVATASGASVVTLHYDSDANTVTRVASITTGNQVWGANLSADGTTLYVGNNTGSLLVYAINDAGSLTLTSTVASIGARGYRIEVSSDGSSIYAGGFFTAGGLSTIKITNAVAGSHTEGHSSQVTSALQLSDSEYDAFNGGVGNYNGASITISRSGGADPTDGFGLTSENGLTLNGNVISLNNTAIATFESVDGKLTIRFTADVSKATANAVLQQISYTNASKDPGKTITLQVTAGDLYATSSSLDVIVSVTEVNDAPTLTATPIAATYVNGASSGVRLFEGTDISAVELGQTITSLTLTVSGITNGESETLTIDGKAINLVDGISTTTSGYDVSVTISGNVATIMLTSSNGLAVADSVKLVNSITYANDTGVTSGTRTVTLTAIQDSGGIANGGVDTTTLAITSTVTLSERNTAPSLSTNTSQATYTENGEPASPFSGTVVSTGEDGQTITQLGLTVAGLRDGESEVLTVDGTAITLVDGKNSTTSNGYTVTVTMINGTATVTVTSTSGIPSAEIAALINGIAYANTSEDPSAGARELTITRVQDNGGTANGGSNSATPNITATIDVQPVNDAPVLVSKATTAVYAISSSSVTLFAGTSIDVVENGQSISAITLTVSGLLNGRSETITVDNNRIALVNGTTVTSNGYSVTVTLSSDGSATVTITSNEGIATENAAALIDGIAYVNLSSTYTAGDRHFTLTVQDSGGVANGGSDTTTLGTAASLTLVNNSAPVLGSSPDKEVLVEIESLTAIAGLQNVTATVFSSDGSALYAVSSDGAIAFFSRDLNTGALVHVETIASGLASASDVQFSPGNDSLYVLGNSGEAIAVFSRSAIDGSLLPAQVIETNSVRDFTVAADGTLYVVDGNYSGLLVYSLGDNGEYTQVQAITASANTEPYLFTGVDVKVVGNHVYVITNPASSALADTLIVYTRNTDGTLGDSVYLRDSTDASLIDPLDLAVSTDGGTIYVATAQGVSIFSFEGGVLAKAGTITGLTSVTALALAQDGINLYVSSADGIGRYDVRNTSAPVLQQTLTNISSSTDLSVAANGALAASTGSALVNLRTSLAESLKSAYTEKGELLLAGNITWSDTDHDAMEGGAGNYNGASITISRSGEANANDGFGLATGHGLTVSNGMIQLGEATIASFAVDRGQLTITFTADVNTTVANQILQQITYSNSSKDPGNTATLELVVRDVYGASDSVELALTITEVNDAPTAIGSTLNPSYVEGSAAVQVFDGSTISAVEAGQHITELQFAISGLADGASETLSVDGTVINLVVGQSGSTTNGHAYSVQLNESGEITLVIRLNDDSSGEAAGLLMDSIAYANTSQDPTEGQRMIRLVAVSDDGGTANGGKNTTIFTTELASSIDVKAVNNAPALISNGANTISFTQGDNAVLLFSDTFVDTGEGNQTILSLTLSVSGLRDGSSETLTIAGQSIALTTGTTTVNGYTVVVSLSGDTATVAIHSASGVSAANASALINGIAFANNSNIPTEGTRSIALTTVRDSGGTENNGTDSTALAIVARVNVAGVVGGNNGGTEQAHNGYIAPTVAWPPLSEETHTERENDALSLSTQANAAFNTSLLTTPSLQQAFADLTAPVHAADLLDTLLPKTGYETSEGSVQVSFADGQSSPLVVLASEDGPTLQAQVDSIAGQWQRDLAGNRMVFQLPAGLIASSTTIATAQLRGISSRPIPSGVRLDLASGRIIAPGYNATPVELQIVVRTVDGQSVTVPVRISPAASALSHPASIVDNGHRDSVTTAKPALSEQLHQGATNNLLTQAQSLLEQLASDTAVVHDTTDTRAV